MHVQKKLFYWTLDIKSEISLSEGARFVCELFGIFLFVFVVSFNAF